MSLEPGNEIPEISREGEVVVLTLQGTGRMTVEDQQVQIRPDTTLVIPSGASRQVVNSGKEELIILLIRTLVPA